MGMSIEDFKSQKLTGRFRILEAEEARAADVPFADCYRDDGYLLVEFSDGAPVRILGGDGGQPEDQSLVRDWAWVAVELNKLEAEK